MGMRELTLQEVQQVNGGIIPGIYGALFLGARLAANPAIRGAVIAGLKIAGLGFTAGFTSWYGGAGASWLHDRIVGEEQEKP